MQRQKNIWLECSARRRTLQKLWNAHYEQVAWTPVRYSSFSPALRSSGAVARALATRDKRRDVLRLETRLITEGKESDDFWGELEGKPNEEIEHLES